MQNTIEAPSKSVASAIVTPDSKSGTDKPEVAEVQQAKSRLVIDGQLVDVEALAKEMADALSYDFKIQEVAKSLGLGRLVEKSNGKVELVLDDKIIDKAFRSGKLGDLKEAKVAYRRDRAKSLMMISKGLGLLGQYNRLA